MFDPTQLAALSAILRNGSFERAARVLGLTQSAVSQRIRLLEEQVGTPLIIRAQPCRATEAGARVFRHAEELRLLEQELRTDLGIGRELGALASGGTGADARGWPAVRVAVNADSLATWFLPALAAAGGLLFDLVVDDQDHSADWLKRGEVRAAISSASRPVQGCDCRPLGALRYLATASPAFCRRWFGEEGVTPAGLQRAPMLTFNAKDRLQSRWAEQAFGASLAGPSHWLPSSQAFVDAAAAGLGWGMNPEALAAPALADGRLMVLKADCPLDVPLYWHVSRSVQRLMQPVTRAVVEAARRALKPVL
ncbi:LysR family transcriptional regulator [Rhizobium sp. Root274]|uniref:LysR family transcriptional regulator ArgP n=1 Tax=unclassified Rhizobium TaxID=2613769 RepID=UPI0007149049|nr:MULTISPECIES: LysR family transcriptional regulator ArgP [unclassified Rhizobium]KQW28909.1 LysR family transcriptional regulator [Rhizobium sp. Root1240]KRD29105.1 LysR family transcriptional regulator [Rhizobium sp. Root274]